MNILGTYIFTVCQVIKAGFRIMKTPEKVCKGSIGEKIVQWFPSDQIKENEVSY